MPGGYALPRMHPQSIVLHSPRGFARTPASHPLGNTEFLKSRLARTRDIIIENNIRNGSRSVTNVMTVYRRHGLIQHIFPGGLIDRFADRSAVRHWERTGTAKQPGVVAPTKTIVSTAARACPPGRNSVRPATYRSKAAKSRRNPNGLIQPRLPAVLPAAAPTATPIASN